MNTTENFTEFLSPSPSVSRNLLSGPGYMAYNVILILFIQIPTTVLNLFILIGLLKQKQPLSVLVKNALVNICLSGLFTGFGIFMNRTSIIVLILNPQMEPHISFCKITLWIMISGLTCLLLYMAVFALIVLHIVRSQVPYQPKLYHQILINGAIWLSCLTFCASAFSPVILQVSYIENTTCSPLTTGPSLGIIIFFYVILFCLLPFGIAVSSPIAALCYIRKHTALADLYIKKAMARFTFFLLVANTTSMIAIVLPTILVGTRRGEIMEAHFIPFPFLMLSLLSIPILMIAIFKPLRKAMKKGFYRLHTCTRGCQITETVAQQLPSRTVALKSESNTHNTEF